ncbi:two-partner secretion domain-containing protein [Mastigocoleus testarum]|uniref:Filamentous haemagglutinin FhaB/tRNA nuclease CdiA-like TPS domain-containing protein n=1 Tax=Mastigocoleus testarum BC008 TaxID=371196 RepID=A0A0V7ZC17_9CYAN|nr:filamentous hemagglutinin N-terminal domain-containing protein [Mastigocoleus testarum]KST62050.1 hypothetical protein BC008_08455 [Mastigocoleus testarum BC008]
MLGQPLVVVNYSIFYKVIRLSAIVSLQFLLFFLDGFWQGSANAQITPDASLGTEASKVTPNVEIKGSPAERIDGGATRGINLFHSFSEFNVGESQRVYFNNPAGIENILTRVTGGKVSNILGTLGVDGRANLFFINPGGIVFGQNSSLDLGGSFVGSTANSFVFDDKFKFSATNPQTPPLLKINVPTGLQFGKNSQDIRVDGISGGRSSIQGLGLRVSPGNTLALIGGNINIEGVFLNAPEGQIELGSVAGIGQVNLKPINRNWILDYDNFQNFGNINISRSLVDIAAVKENRLNNPNEDTAISFRAAKLDIGRTSVIRANNGTDAPGADINIDVRQLIVREGANISTLTRDTGNAGNLIVNATESVKLTGTTPRGFFKSSLNTQTDAAGKGGNLIINTASLEVSNGALITSTTKGTGDAGDITINATNFVKFGGEGDLLTGAFSQVNPLARGNGGGISITTPVLEVDKNGQISTSTFGSGNAGSVRINATGRVKFDGGGDFLSGVFSQVAPGAIANAGSVFINTNAFEMDNNAAISTSTLGLGNSGTIIISANTFKATNSSQIANFTTNKFTAGNIAITARDSIILSGSQTGIFANTTPNSIGGGGGIIIDSGTTTIRDNATVAVDSQGEGIGGDIQLGADFLTLDKGIISAETRSSTGGSITLKIKDLLLLRNNSKISTTAGNQQFGGDGGNINIDTPFIVASPQENNDITANAFSGRGGKINVTTQGIFGLSPRSREELENLLNTNNPANLDPNNLSSSDITAISQQNPSLSGQISINNIVEPSQGTEEFPTDVIDATGLINRNICIAARQGSEFVITGKGGLPPSPYNIFSPNSTWEDWSITQETNISKPKPKTKPIQTKNQLSKPIEQNKYESPNPIVEAQDWVLDGNGNVVLTSQPVKVTQEGTWLRQEDCQRLRIN